MTEHFKCAVCGTLIDSETGENFVSKDSNAYKIETMKEKLDELQHDLKRVMEENERLREGKTNGKGKENNLRPGGSEEEGGVEGDVEGKTDGDTGGDKGGEGFWDK